MPVEDGSESPLEGVERRLYAPQAVDAIGVPSFRGGPPPPPEHWKTPPPPPAKPKKISGPALFLIFAVVFFVVAGGATAAILFFGARSVGSGNVAISTEGSPFTASGGADVPISIAIRNGNPAPITDAVLSLQFPDGTTEATNTAVALGNWNESLGTLAAGETVRRTVHASFFGSENQKITVPITLEYKTQDSNATFEKKQDYAITISTSPVGLTLTTLSEVPSGQPITLSVLVRSNASTPLSNVAVRATYPTGFSVKSTDPASPDNFYFQLGTLAPGEEREIRVTGTLIGSEGDERVFRFDAGASKSADSKEFAVSYLSKDAPVTIAKPFFSVGLSLNHDDASPTIVVSAGDAVSGLLSWSNPLSSAIQDGQVSVALSGAPLFDNVNVTNGFYRSGDTTILYDRDTASGLARLNPGDTGNGSFTINTKSGAALSSLRNPSMTLSVSVSGRRTGQTGVPESANSVIVRTIKMATSLSVSSKAVRTVGPFTNTGAFPPVADAESTYTIELGVGNTVNSVANAVATMTLPSYVRYTGQATPGIKYNASTREVTWTVGDLAPGAAGDAAFQVGFTGSASQKGQSPTLVSGVSISGFDRFVGKTVQGSAQAVTTDVRSDPAYNQAAGTVH